MAKNKFKIPGVSFSLNRALGITQAKQKLTRKIGIPLTKAGRQRKVGQALGCAVFIAPIPFVLILVIMFLNAA